MKEKYFLITEYKKNNPQKWEKVVNFAMENWDFLVENAKNISIAEQLENFFNIPPFVSKEISNSVNLLKKTILKK